MQEVDGTNGNRYHVGMAIRLLNTTEIPLAQRMIWEVFSSSFAPLYTEAGAELFRRFVEDRVGMLCLTHYGAFQDGALDGVISLRGSEHIACLFVRQRAQGQGIGRALFQKVLDATHPAWVTTDAAPSAVGFYQKLGFEIWSEEQYDRGMRYIPMIWMDE